MMKILLITGIPGMGKTTIGNHLRDVHDYIHIDMENSHDWPQEFQIYGSVVSYDAKFADQLMNALKNKGKNIVITWGFLPGYADKILLTFISHGAKMVWFDGNRIAARKAFIKRGTVSEQALNIQMDNINNSDLLQVFQPTIIDTFDEKGEFLKKEELTLKLLAL